MKDYNNHCPGPKKGKINFLNRTTADPFQKKFEYIEDAYERSEDMRKLDY